MSGQPVGVAGLGFLSERSNPGKVEARSVAKGLYVAFTSPAGEAADEEFNRWYSNHHLPEVLSLPGINSASRYRSLDDSPSHAYMVLYELSASDLRAVVARIHAEAAGRTPTAAMRRNPPTDFRLFEFLERREST
jgi:hypothetical protein